MGVGLRVGPRLASVGIPAPRTHRPSICSPPPKAVRFTNGRQLEEVKDYLGHSSIRVTSDRYGHLFPKAKAEMADALEATFRGVQPEISRTIRGLAADWHYSRTRSRDANSVPDLRFLLERTTGLEPATLTLAR